MRSPNNTTTTTTTTPLSLTRNTRQMINRCRWPTRNHSHPAQIICCHVHHFRRVLIYTPRSVHHAPATLSSKLEKQRSHDPMHLCNVQRPTIVRHRVLLGITDCAVHDQTRRLAITGGVSNVIPQPLSNRSRLPGPTPHPEYTPPTAPRANTHTRNPGSQQYKIHSGTTAIQDTKKEAYSEHAHFPAPLSSTLKGPAQPVTVFLHLSFFCDPRLTRTSSLEP